MNDSLPPALESLLRQQRWLRRLAASLVVDAAQADDLAQEALLSALERPPADAHAPRAWLATVVRNIARRFGASERSRSARERAVARLEALPPTDEVVSRAALHAEVAMAILALDEPYRGTVLLRFFDEMKPGAIARRLEVPVETVRTRIKRGLELLRAELIARRAAAAPDRSGNTATQWAIALVGLLDGATRRVVRRAVLTKSSAAAVAVGSVGIGGWLGAVAMSTKLKLAAGAVFVLAGAVATWTIERSANPIEVEQARAVHGVGSVAAASDLKPPADPASAAVTRSAELVESRVHRESDGDSSTTSPHDGCELLGNVLTPEGALAAGAVVWVEDGPGDAGYRADSTAHGLGRSVESVCNNIAQFVGRSNRDPGPGNTFRVVTSADGRFRFDRIEENRPFNLAAACLDAGVASVTNVLVTRGESPKRVDLVLTPGITFSGLVTDDGGVTIPEVKIGVERVVFDDSGRERASRVGGCNADKEGRFRTLPLPFSSFYVHATAEGFLDQTLPRIDALPGQRAVELAVRLERAPTLRGRILRRDGSPAGIASVKDFALVAVASENPPSAIGGFHGPEGERGNLIAAEDRFEITPHRGRLRYVSIWAGRSELGEREIVDVKLPLDITVDLERAPPAIPRGSLLVEVVDAEHHDPITQFNVEYARQRADHTESEWGGSSRTGASSPTGTKQLDGLPVGPYDVCVDAEGFARRAAWVEVAAEGTPHVIHFELAPAVARLAGRVVDDQESPIGMARVQLLAPCDPRALPSQLDATVTDMDGRFAFERLAEANYVVVAIGSPLGPAAVSVPARRVRSETSVSAKDVVITLHRSVSVAFVVSGRGGRDAESVCFRIRDERGIPIYDGDRHGGLETGGGSANFRLAPGSYTVEAMNPGFETGRASFVATEGARVEIELVPR